MSKNIAFSALLAAAILGASAARAAESGLYNLGPLGGIGVSYANGLSADGSVMVGYVLTGTGLKGFRWADNGSGGTTQNLDVFPGHQIFSAYGVNANGSVVVGTSQMAGMDMAFRWAGDDSGGVIQDLGVLAGGTRSAAYGVNADGSVVVGLSDTPGGERAFRWSGDNSGGVMQDLGVLAGGTSSAARGVNADGSVVVGTSNTPGGERAFRWSGDDSGGVMQDLGVLAGGTSSLAYSVNNDGSVVVGRSVSAGGDSAFRWVGDDSGGVMQDLGVLGDASTAVAFDVNGDGTIVVGRSDPSSGGRAFRWADNGTPQGRMISVEDWLRENGVTVAGDITASAQAVSDDGMVIVGQTIFNTAFLARVSAAGSGMIDMNHYMQSLESGGFIPLLAGAQADLALNGAHSAPLRGLLSEGQSSMWITGDIGRKDHGAWNAAQGLGEVGYSHGITPFLQIGLAAGTGFSRHDSGFGGHIDYSGVYLLPELIWQVQGNLYLSLSGYYNDGNAETRRGYLNAGALDSSSGKTDVKSRGGRIRADWLDAFHAFDAGFTPNISYTYTKAKMDSYTETGGGFPVSWAAQSEKSNIVRLGLDAVRPVTPALNLLARVEGAYRFEEESNPVGGQIIGLSGFTFDGRGHDRLWARGGIGAEAAMGGGAASLMLNGSTAGGNSDYWFSASYRVRF